MKHTLANRPLPEFWSASGTALLWLLLLPALLTGCVTTATHETSRVGPAPLVGPMLHIPSGRVLMGVAAGDTTGWPNEMPVHEIAVAAFELSAYEVTLQQWEAYVAETPHAAPGCGETPLHATGCIGWDDAQAYLVWLGHKTGLAYRLPSEAEWEYAARAGVRTRFPWGDLEKHACRFANINPCKAMGKQPVGRYPPNPFGLYDLIGNVAEWTQDCWHESYDGAPVDGSAWLQGDCAHRVMRGGAFDDRPVSFRLSMRGFGGTMPRGDFQGFRVARSLP